MLSIDCAALALQRLSWMATSRNRLAARAIRNYAGNEKAAGTQPGVFSCKCRNARVFQTCILARVPRCGIQLLSGPSRVSWEPCRHTSCSLHQGKLHCQLHATHGCAHSRHLLSIVTVALLGGGGYLRFRQSSVAI